MRNCTWRTAPPGNDCVATHAHLTHRQLSNATIGILGYGHIGVAIAERAAAFGTRVIATTLDPPAQPPAPLAWIGDDSDNARLFAEADFVVVCTPLLNATRGLVDAALLEQLDVLLGMQKKVRFEGVVEEVAGRTSTAWIYRPREAHDIQ